MGACEGPGCSHPSHAPAGVSRFLVVEVLDCDGQVLERHSFGPLVARTLSLGRSIRVTCPPFEGPAPDPDGWMKEQ